MKKSLMALISLSLLSQSMSASASQFSDDDLLLLTSTPIWPFATTWALMASNLKKEIVAGQQDALAVLAQDAPSAFFSELRTQIEAEVGRAFDSDIEAAVFMLQAVEQAKSEAN